MQQCVVYLPPQPMLETSVWTILKEFTEGIPKQGRVLTYFLISWTIEV